MARIDLEDFKNENSSLLDKIQSLSDEKSRLMDKAEHLEHQLVTAVEKHKICQLEVNEWNKIMNININNILMKYFKKGIATRPNDL